MMSGLTYYGQKPGNVNGIGRRRSQSGSFGYDSSVNEARRAAESIYRDNGHSNENGQSCEINRQTQHMQGRNLAMRRSNSSTNIVRQQQVTPARSFIYGENEGPYQDNGHRVNNETRPRPPLSIRRRSNSMSSSSHNSGFQSKPFPSTILTDERMAKSRTHNLTSGDGTISNGNAKIAAAYPTRSIEPLQPRRFQHNVLTNDVGVHDVVATHAITPFQNGIGQYSTYIKLVEESCDYVQSQDILKEIKIKLYC